MEVDEVPLRRPSNAQLARGINQLHACLEDHRSTTERELKEIKVVLGVGKDVRTPFGLQPQWRAFLQTSAAVVAAFFTIASVLKVTYILWPSLSKVALALWNAIVEGRI